MASLWRELASASWVANSGIPLVLTIATIFIGFWLVRRQMRHARLVMVAESRAHAARALASTILSGTELVRLSSDEDGRRHWRLPPSLVSAITAVAVLVAALALNAVKTNNGEGGTAFLDSPNFKTWIAIAAFSATLWLALMLRGWRLLRRLGLSWHVALDVIAYLFLAVAVVGMLGILRRDEALAVPVVHWEWRTRSLLILAGLAGLPWMLAVWRIHRDLHGLHSDIEEVIAPAKGPNSLPTSVEGQFAERPKTMIEAANDPNPSPVLAQGQLLERPEKILLQRLITRWEDIQHVILALSMVVTPAVLTTGALRLAVVPDYVKSEDFPPASVVLYGLFFAAFVAGAVLPIILSWRSRAREFVGFVQPLPEDGKPTQEFADNRARIESLLNLDVGYLRSPITALGILAPLLTAAIAALVPTAI